MFRFDHHYVRHIIYMKIPVRYPYNPIYQPDSILQTIETLNRHNEWMEIKDDSAPGILYRYAHLAIQPITRELKLQNMKAKKKTAFGYTFNLLDKFHGYRLDGEIDIEVFDPLLHQEIAVNNLPIDDIGIPGIDHWVKDSMGECLDDIQAERDRLIRQIEIGESLAHESSICCGARRICKIINTGHILTVVAAIYPLSLPVTKHLLNKFFRSNPANNTDTN